MTFVYIWHIIKTTHSPEPTRTFPTKGGKMKIKTRPRNPYRWFLEPLDDRTNRIIANHCSPEDACWNVQCADGFSHNLWRCSFKICRVFIASKVESQLRFNVFCQKDHGKIKNVNFLFFRRKKGKKKKSS